MKRPILRVILLALVAVAAAAPARAFTNKLQYTGKILDATGATVGSVSSIKLDVFSDTTTAAIWTNTYATVPLDAGRFAIDLDLTPVSAAPLLAAVTAGTDLWLRTTFTPTGGSAVVMPFQRFAPVAYAVTAGSAVTGPGEKDASGLAADSVIVNGNAAGSQAAAVASLTLNPPAAGWIVVEGSALASISNSIGPVAVAIGLATTSGAQLISPTPNDASSISLANVPAGAAFSRATANVVTPLTCRAVFHVLAGGAFTCYLNSSISWDGVNNGTKVSIGPYHVVARYYDRQY